MEYVPGRAWGSILLQNWTLYTNTYNNGTRVLYAAASAAVSSMSDVAPSNHAGGGEERLGKERRARWRTTIARREEENFFKAASRPKERPKIPVFNTTPA